MIFIKNLKLLIIFWEQSISVLENFTVHISSLLIDEIKMKPNDIDFKSNQGSSLQNICLAVVR